MNGACIAEASTVLFNRCSVNFRLPSPLELLIRFCVMAWNARRLKAHHPFDMVHNTVCAHTPNTIHCTCKSKLTNNGTNSSISRCCVQTTNSRICIQMIRVLWSTLLFDAMNILFAFVANLCNYRAIYSSVPFAIHFSVSIFLGWTFPSTFPSFHQFWCFSIEIHLFDFFSLLSLKS